MHLSVVKSTVSYSLQRKVLAFCQVSSGIKIKQKNKYRQIAFTSHLSRKKIILVTGVMV